MKTVWRVTPEIVQGRATGKFDIRHLKLSPSGDKAEFPSGLERSQGLLTGLAVSGLLWVAILALVI